MEMELSYIRIICKTDVFVSTFPQNTKGDGHIPLRALVHSHLRNPIFGVPKTLKLATRKKISTYGGVESNSFFE